MGRTERSGLRFALPIIGSALALVVGMAVVCLRFASYRDGYCGIQLSNSKAEVMYRLGYPPYVLGQAQPEKTWGGYASPVYTTDRAKDPKNAMPNGTKPTDFDQWSYTSVPAIGHSGRLDVSFQQPNGQVEQIACLGDSPKSCPSLAGISIGTTEEELRQSLGEPDKQKLDGVAKTMVYEKLGLAFYLTKEKVYNIALLQPTRGRWYAASIHIRSMFVF